MNDTKKVELIQNDNTIKIDKIEWPQDYIDLINNIELLFNIKKNDNNSSFIIKIVDSDDDEKQIDSQDDLIEYCDNIKLFKVYLEDIDIDIDLKKLINSKITNDFNKINIEDNLKENNFEIKEYEEILNKEKDLILSEFNNNINEDLNKIIEQESEIIKSNIDIKLSEHINIISEKEKNYENKINTFSNDLNDINEKINEIYLATEELKYLEPNPNQNPNQNPIPKNSEDIIFIKNKIELEIENKKAGYIEINDISIKNISRKTFKSLCFILDMEKSSKDCLFLGNLSDDLQQYELSVLGAQFSPGKIHEYNTVLRIQYPKPEQIYKVYLYIRDLDKNTKVSNLLEINIKIAKIKIKDDPNKLKEIEINKIYEELNKEIENLENIVNIKDLKDKIKEKNCDKNAVKSWILQKINEKESLIKENAENMYNELIKNIETHLSKNLIIEKIIKEKLNLEELKQWVIEENKKNEENNKIINEEQINKNLEELYDEINKEFDLNDKDKNEIIEKIKELNCDEKKIKEFYKLEKAVEEFDEEYNVTGFIDEELFKDKIKEYNFDRDKIIKWIEENLGNF